MGTAQTTFEGSDGELPEVTWPEEALTESMSCACPASSRVLFLTIAVVQVPWVPEVTQGHVTPSVSTLLGPFDRKWHYETSPVVTEGGEGCAYAWSEVPLGCSLGRPRLSLSTRTSPFTGYLPLSRHFIFMGSPINNYTTISSVVFGYVQGVV
jgi:hypothetical protein